MPVPQYSFFIDDFINSIRYETARSAEKAYQHLSVRDALEVFMLDNETDLQTFVDKEKRNGVENGVEWVVEGDVIKFLSDKQDQLMIPSEKMIQRSLQYAVDLERIV